MTKVLTIEDVRVLVLAHRVADTGAVTRAANVPSRRVVGGFGIVAALLGGVSLAGCASESAAEDVTVVDVELGNFVIEPSLVTVPAGPVELRVTNTDAIVHDLVAASKGTRPLQPGESQTLPMGDLVAGEYRMWCDQPGHAQMGQVGTLVVTPASPQSGG